MKRRAGLVRSRSRTPAREAGAPGAEHQWRLGVLETNFTTLKMENEQLLTHVAHLRYSHEHFAKVFEQAPVSLLVINDLGTILDWNASARRFLQLPRGAIRGGFFGQFLASGNRAVF